MTCLVGHGHGGIPGAVPVLLQSVLAISYGKAEETTYIVTNNV